MVSLLGFSLRLRFSVQEVNTTLNYIKIVRNRKGDGDENEGGGLTDKNHLSEQ